MKKFILVLLLIVIASVIFNNLQKKNVLGDSDAIGAPPYGESFEDVPHDPYAKYRNWKRPEGLAKVGLQVGHWKSEEQPDELEKLRNNTGSSGGGKWEWEVNLAIAQETKKLLEQKEIIVEILPATIPPEYWADVFVAIHADGSLDRLKSGYKVASPWRDFSGKANSLVKAIEDSYSAATGFEKDPNITRNMRGYYAFAWWRYEHSIHPMTTASILETGFLTNALDRKIIVNNPQVSANGLAEGIINFLKEEELL